MDHGTGQVERRSTFSRDRAPASTCAAAIAFLRRRCRRNAGQYLVTLNDAAAVAVAVDWVAFTASV
jgi:uncharacterized protein (DUF2461 family)